MKVLAARLMEHGKPLRVEDVELPAPGPGELRVELSYAGVNPVDRYGALGRVAPDGPLPRTLGGEAAGRVGDRTVVVRGHGLGSRRDGLWASAAVVPEEALIDVPEGVDLRTASVMGVAGVTAWRCVTEKAAVTEHDRVLVLGASGGVGSIIISIVKAIGATVWGQTGSPDKEAWIRARGADEVVVAGADHVADAVRSLMPTVVFDPLGDGFFGAAVTALSERGRLVPFGTSADPTGEVPLQALYRKGLTVYGYAGLIEPDEATAGGIRSALDALRDGRLQIVIGETLPLHQVNEALEALASRRVSGKLVLNLNAGEEEVG